MPDPNKISLLQRLRDWIEGERDDAPPAPTASVILARPPDASPPTPDASPRAEARPADEPLDLLQADIVRGMSGDARAVNEAFNASQPVGDRYELSGRAPELSRLVRSVIDGWHHAVIFGARGVGKTSLARVFGDLTDEAGCDVFYHSASGDLAFEEVVRPYLRFIGESAGRAGAGPAIDALGERFGARDAADALAAATRRRAFLILDEFDRITDARTRSELAALLKLLSDFRVPVQFVIVGISTDVDTLVQEHPSLRRHMVAVRVGPIAPTAIAELLAEGARRAGLRFAPDVAEAITAVALGSPYHARLLALESALAAGDEGAADGLVDAAAFGRGLEAAWADWEGVSPGAARLFGKLARDAQARDALAAVAIVAGAEYAFDEARITDALLALDRPDAPAAARAALDALAPELRPVEDRLVFRDSLAPQFLLLAMVRGGRGADGIGSERAAAHFRGMADRIEAQRSGAGPIGPGLADVGGM